jgi:hypothetical protein
MRSTSASPSMMALNSGGDSFYSNGVELECYAAKPRRSVVSDGAGLGSGAHLKHIVHCIPHDFVHLVHAGILPLKLLHDLG